MTDSGSAVMPTPPARPGDKFTIGQRVVRVNDGMVGTIATIGNGGYGVRWEPSGVIQMVMPALIRTV